MERLQASIDFILNDLRQLLKAVQKFDSTAISIIDHNNYSTEYYNICGLRILTFRNLNYCPSEKPMLYQNKWELHQLNLGIL